MKKSILLSVIVAGVIAVCVAGTSLWSATTQPESASATAGEVTCPASGSNPYVSSTFPSNTLLQAIVFNAYPTAKGAPMKFMGKFQASGTGVYTWNAYSYASATGDFNLYSINLVKTDTNYWLYTFTISTTTCSGLLQKTYTTN